MRLVVDENVSYDVVGKLRKDGHEVIAISELSRKSMSDQDVYELVLQRRAVLVTRDYHFSNPVRFPSENTEGIIYIRHGNLKSAEETAMVEGFLRGHDVESYRGRLVTLYRDGIRIR